MKKEGITYTVHQVATMIGISKQLLRKWENRYHIITPGRLENGYRIYSQSDVTALQHMKQLIDNGSSPQNAAEILKKRQGSENEQLALFQVNPPRTLHPQSDQFVKQLLHFGQNGEDAHMLKLLQQAQFSMSVDQLLDDVISPFLRQVDNYMASRIWGEVQEVLASLAVRDFLVNLRRAIVVPADAPLIVGSCLPGERHEIPMQISLIKCMLRGYQTVMLGPSPTLRAIESTITLKEPAIVLLTASTSEPFDTRRDNLLALDAFAKTVPHIKFYVSGASAERFQFDTMTVAQDLHEMLK